jgi:ABC-type uncharacterized transport system permease subunit
MPSYVLPFVAVVALLPALIYARRGSFPDAYFWPLMAIAGMGLALPALELLFANRFSGIGGALAISNAATILLFLLAALISPAARGLAALLLPYCLCLAVLAALGSLAPAAAVPQTQGAEAWLDLHILVSVGTYGLVTLAAVAGLAVFLQERALKRRHGVPAAGRSVLPAIADAERLQNRLLVASAIVLAVGLLTGVGTLYGTEGVFFAFTHKTIFAVAAFVVLVVLVLVHNLTGLRGRRAARIVLVAYLLLTLAYIGVKFVEDVLIG